jgi:hypothetical protein
MVNTTWNPADIAAGMVLSNGNLTASNTGNFTGVRAAKGWNAGKYYFEFTVTAMTSGYVGLAKSTYDLTSGGTSGAVGVNGSGSVDVNGVTTGVGIGSVSGSLLGIAIDITGNLVWFRSGAAGSWNATSGTANNPVTGVGGISLSAIAGTLFPWFEAVFAPSQSVTANFGDSAFSGAVPSGYTAGWLQAISNTTWSTTDKTAAVTVSGGGLTVSAGSTGTINAVRTTDRQISGKYYWEITTSVNTVNSGIGAAHAGVVLSNTNMSSAGGSIGCAFVNTNGTVFIDGVSFGSALGSLTVGTIVCIALDLTNQRIWFRYGAAGNWNASAGNNPATNVGGFPVPFNVNGLAAAYPLAVFTSPTGATQTANFGDTAFTGTVPVGFTSGFPTGTPTLIAANTQMLVEEWGAPNPAAQLTQLLLEEWTVVVPPPFTSWSPGDKTASFILGNNNLTVTCAGATGSIRAVDKQITGKFYWEHTVNARATATGFAGGVMAGYIPVGASWPSSAGLSGICGVSFGGSIYTDGTSPASISAVTSGSLVGIAVNATTRLIWFRLGAAGNWNGSASADPATGVGGVPITAGLGIPLYPAVWLQNNTDQITANFGDTAFTGTVPSGFTAGFPAGAVTPNNELATQIAAEQWGLMIPPDMRATQAVIEQWTSTANVTTRMLMTQEAIEQWSTVAEASAITARQAALTVVT